MKKDNIRILTAMALGKAIEAHNHREDDDSEDWITFVAETEDSKYYIKTNDKLRVELTAVRCIDDFRMVIAEFNMEMRPVVLVNELAEAIWVFDIMMSEKEES